MIKGNSVKISETFWGLIFRDSSIDGIPVYLLKKVISNDIPEDIFYADMRRRALYTADRYVDGNAPEGSDVDNLISQSPSLAQAVLGIVLSKYERCLKRLKKEWVPKLKDRGLDIPVVDEDLCNLIFKQSDYRNRTQRDKENKK